jgi:hypothetical protein
MGSYVCVAGKMKDEVWQSKLVRFLAHSDDLDSIPWKEMIFHRVGSGRDRVMSDDYKSYEQEFVTDPKSGKQSWVLPGTDKAPFRLTKWMNTMYSFNSGYEYVIDFFLSFAPPPTRTLDIHDPIFKNGILARCVIIPTLSLSLEWIAKICSNQSPAVSRSPQLERKSDSGICMSRKSLERISLSECLEYTTETGSSLTLR